MTHSVSSLLLATALVAVASCSSVPQQRVSSAPSPATPSSRDDFSPPALARSHVLHLHVVDEGLPRQGQWRQGLAVADMNGDGKPDLILTSPRNLPGPPVIFLNQGKDRWERWSDTHFPPLAWDYGGIAAGDFDGDGLMDLAIGAHYRGVAVLLGDGHGTFHVSQPGLQLRAASASEGAVPFSSRAIAAVDWNGDGRLDVAALSDGPRPGATTLQEGLTVFENAPAGWTPRRAPGTDRTFGDGIAVGDVDGDGKSDLVTTSQRVGAKGILRLGADPTLAPHDVSTLLPGSVVDAVALRDLDHDGRDEILLGYATGMSGRWSVGIDVVSWRDGRATSRRIWWEEGNHRIDAIAAGDLDGDGVDDIVAVTDDGRLLTFHGDGHGFVTGDAVIEAPAWRSGCSGSALQVRDLDGDGKAEVVATFAGERTLSGNIISCPSGGGIEVWRAEPAP